MTQPDYDLCIIGGGVNGAGIARDAAGRGLRVLLAEAQDLAGATSSASTKLVHGGLRYLEYHEFRLVREALHEREVLLGLAPHIIRPMEFILPHDAALRPAWLIRLGLFLYDHLGGRKKLKGSHGLHLSAHDAGTVLQSRYWQGFSYQDCWVDDARLVVLNAMDAAERGATIMTRTACTALAQEGNLWRITLCDMATGQEQMARAAMLINAAGPWVRTLLDNAGLTGPETPQVRLVKGSHIIVNRLYDGDHAFILQQPDRRIVFVIPYEHDFTLIGTTEVDFDGDPAAAAIAQGEIDYLCAAVNRSFKTPVTPEQIIHTYSGVRPLLDDDVDDATAATRDYKLILDRTHGPPVLSVFGGKITTYRRLAEHALDELCSGQRWTATTPLPGGDIDSFDDFLYTQIGRYPWLPEDQAARYARAYGTRMDIFLEGKAALSDLGRHYGDHVYEAEIRYLVAAEWARTAEDILWRRSKLGLHVSEETIQELERFLPSIIREITNQ